MFHTAIAEKAGLSATDSKTMDILARHGPVTAGELSAHTGLATASVTSLIDRLEAKGMVRRVRDPADRRRVIVEPVAARIVGAASFFGSIQREFEALVKHYSDDQLETILDFMRGATEKTREITSALTRKGQSRGSVPAPGGHLRTGRPPSEKG
jgi:DNA-binding MarR family transcriptional regulator